MARTVVPKDFPIWDCYMGKKMVSSFTIELTARCNNNCRHCYLNLPENDGAAKSKELSLSRLEDIANQAVARGALFCLLTGGEPLLHDQFEEIYIMLKKKGLLVSVFTNATLITQKHIDLFKKLPPYAMEVTVYGITPEVYDKVVMKKGMFARMKQGLQLLADNHIPVRLKAMVMRSNLEDFKNISDFCREMTTDYYRFDPLLHLRIDGDEKRNALIRAERLTPEEIVKVEQTDAKRFKQVQKTCERTAGFGDAPDGKGKLVFSCGAGKTSFVMRYDGRLCLCSSLTQDEYTYDISTGSLADYLENFVCKVRSISTCNPEFLNRCAKCKYLPICYFCPARSLMETGRMDQPADAFCQVAEARYRMASGRNL